jgi:ABC-2 type transport system ATP-binding protein
MSEMAQSADHLIVIGRGRLIADAPMREILDGGARARIRVRTEEPARLVDLLTSAGGHVMTGTTDAFETTGLTTRQIARIALDHHVLVHELLALQASLEDAYMELTKDDVEYHSLELATEGR